MSIKTVNRSTRLLTLLSRIPFENRTKMDSRIKTASETRRGTSVKLHDVRTIARGGNLKTRDPGYGRDLSCRGHISIHGRPIRVRVRKISCPSNGPSGVRLGKPTRAMRDRSLGAMTFILRDLLVRSGPHLGQFLGIDGESRGATLRE
jgi:hypothetical protein